MLSQLGMAGEKGAKDITEMCMYLIDQHKQVCQMGVGTLCAQLSDSPKSMEQRARRAVERGLNHLASLGLDDYGNEIFTLYASRLFPFQEVRSEMAFIQGKGPKGKANLKCFLDGMLVLAEEDLKKFFASFHDFVLQNSNIVGKIVLKRKIFVEVPTDIQE